MSNSYCSPGCVSPPASQCPRFRRVLWVALFINAVLFAIEIGGGLQAGSVSLLADAVDFFGDAANYGISLLVLGMALSAVRSVIRQARAELRLVPAHA